MQRGDTLEVNLIDSPMLYGDMSEFGSISEDLDEPLLIWKTVCCRKRASAYCA